MRRINAICSITLLFIITFGFPGRVLSQNQMANLEKYWRYRERLKEDFMIQSSNVDEMGVNIPLSDHNINLQTTNLFGQTFTRFLSAGDGNAIMGNYLGLLSTELWILKNNHQDYHETLKELLYFLFAWERLDAYSESFLRAAEDNGMSTSWDIINWNYSYVYPEDINGFHLRNDFSASFWNNFQSNLSNHYDVDSLKSTFVNPTDQKYYLEASSQDNIINFLIGLSLLNSLVGIEDISNIPYSFNYSIIPDYLEDKGIITGDTVDFAAWAKDLTKRYVHRMQHQQTKFGSLLSLWTHWYLMDPVRNETVAEGDGLDGDLGAIFSHGILGVAEEITGEDLRTQPSDSDYLNYVLHFFNVNLGISKSIRKKSWVLGALDDVLGSMTLDILRSNRASHFENNMPCPMEHLPLINILLYRDRYERNEFYEIDSQEYLSEVFYYDTLLNSANECGPNSFEALNFSAPSSRLNWPENIWKYSSYQVYFHGIDYMFLHNLRYIAFHWVELQDVHIEHNIQEDSVFSSGGDIYICSSVENANVELVGNRSVILEPGFIITGSKFIARNGQAFSGYNPCLYVPLSMMICSSKKVLNIENTNIVENQTTEAQPSDWEITVFPNPVQETLYILCPSFFKKAAILSIYDSKGRLVYSENIDYISETIVIRNFFFGTGIYFGLLRDKNQLQHFKFIKY